MNRGNFLSLTLRSKLILSSVLCVMLPVFITFAYSNITTENVINDQAIANAKNRLEMIDAHIVNLTNSMIDMANYIQFDSEINIILKNQSHDAENDNGSAPAFDTLDYKKVTNKLENLSISRDGMYISILLSEHIYYSNYSFYAYKPTDFYKEPWFKQVQQLPNDTANWNWMGITNNYLSPHKAEDPYMITMVRVIRETSSEPFGYIIISVDGENFNSILNIQANETIKLVDARQTAVVYPQNERSRLMATSGTASHIEADGVHYLHVNHPLGITNWELSILTPYKEAIRKINSVYRSNFVVQALFFAAFLLILVYLVRQFTKPLMKLGRVALAVERGEVGKRSNIRGNNEIGWLSHSFDKMLDRIQEMIKEIRMEQVKKNEAVLKMLQAQVNPHFLFNLLNAIRLRILMNGDEENASLMSSLSSLLRMTISRNNEFISLLEEFDIVVQYVRLMNVRREDKIELIVTLPSECVLNEVPRFLVQPLVENVFNHAIKGTGFIFLSAQKSNDCLVITVEDDGVGMNEQQLAYLRVYVSGEAAEEKAPAAMANRFSGIGIKNIYERLHLIYGDGFAMTIDSKVEEGTKFSLYIPIENKTSRY